MTWQDELQKLDNELASGRISADDYRRRRDEILSGSAGGAPAQAAPQAPFAPPFKWEAKPPSASNSDATQVVPNQAPPQQQQPQQQNPNPDATQVVNTQNRSSDAERTQYVTPVQPGPGGWGQPQQQQSAPPPWIGGDFDAINQPSPGWSHGPEVFDEGSKGGKGKVIGIVLAVVLLAGLGFGAYWLWGRGGTDNNAGGNTTTTSTSTTPSAPPDPLPAGKLPGKVAENKQVKDFTPVPTLKYLLDSEVLSYNVAGATKTKLVQFTTDDGSKGILLIVQAKDAAAAKTAAKELADIQINNGMIEATGAPKGVLVGNLEAKAPDNARVRGHYTSKDLIIRLDMSAKTTEAAQKNFKDALDAQLKALSADE